ncbi:DNA-protecting protein DprA [Endozoicomonas sp. OPT23]|uniref:DNA-processing protein DprA n=1 Tax=Endozoicomonas sp. OPT23 TaxID=2072845 RepID=UPI00129BFFB3|nr:DNA-processing protein DprA [Endozoicomonas sp. OPT23]MRI33371.1 DNA-protecting protein DprA [Endozoicomonas sp. OPT23]
MTDSHQPEHQQKYSDWQQLRKWLLLSFQPGLGPVRFNSLLQEFGSVDAVFSASYTELKQGLPEKLADKIAGNPETPDINAWLENARNWLEASTAHHIISFNSPLYPARLRELNDAPPLLYVIGNPQLLNEPQLAMVGSRRPTPAARRLAQELASELSKAGLVITSGMALGVDTAAHQGTLGGYCSTIAVLGTGVNVVYPQSNTALYAAIAQQGALVSEFPLGTAPTPNNFPKRNRIISGLSLGVLVVEASVKSGSLISARLAAEQGREVFAVPGSVLNPMSKGCHKLIREGAVLVETAEDVLLELQPLLQPLLAEEEKFEPSSELSGAQRVVLESMGFDPVSTDSLSELTGLSWEELSVVLTEMELDGIIASVPGGYVRTRK